MRKNEKLDKTDIYQRITDQIIDSLESGTGPWIKPWNDSSHLWGPYRNGVTERPYRGINILLLNLVSFDKGYSDPRWLTFNDARKLGGHIKKGERHTKIVFWKQLKIEDKDKHVVGTDDEKTQKSKVIPIVRVHRVFNVEQCVGLNLKEITVPDKGNHEDELNDNAEQILALPVIHHGQRIAAYNRKRDFIMLPPRQSFESANHYYATGCHEVVHWTGHESRLARTFGNRFGDKKYAFEELVAEIGAAFLGGSAGLPFKEMRHPEYIQSWISTLKENKRAIFTACRQAQAASDYVFEKVRTREQQTA